MSSGRSSQLVGLLLGRAHEVLDVVEVDAGQVGAPGRHRLLAEQPQALEPQVEHPLRLALLRAEMSRTTSSLTAALGGRTGDVRVGPAELVAARGLPTRGGRCVRSCCVLPRGPWGAGRPLRGSCRWDVRGAHAVAAGDGGESLDVGAEQPREDLGLGLAQLRELRGDVRHRAVVLAQLLAGTGLCGRGRVARPRSAPGQDVHAPVPGAAASTAARYRAPPPRRPGLGEVGHRPARRRSRP